MLNYITTYVHIKKNQVSVNGSIIFETDEKLPITEFLLEVYKTLNISYPKFYKMDLQSKLGMLCCECLVKQSDIFEKNNLDKMAIVLSNNASSLETDRAYQNSINDKENYFPSPAIFVYTLPNIVIGELAIKYKITGENAFFVSEKLDADLLVSYTQGLLTETTESVISGWIDVDGTNYEGFIFLVQKLDDINKNSIFKPLNQLNVITLYNQTQWTH